MSITELGLHPLYELSSVASLIGLLMRNQLTLRLILLFVYALHITENVFFGNAVAFEYTIWNGVFFLINLYVLLELIYGRTTFWFSHEDREIFDRMGGLSPGDFRKMMRLSVRKLCSAETTLTIEGVVPDNLYFIYEGTITISKSGRETPLEPQTFVGEIAFLNRSVASASVRVAPQTRWIEWPAAALRRQVDRDSGLKMVIMRLIGEDLAHKVARA